LTKRAVESDFPARARWLVVAIGALTCATSLAGYISLGTLSGAAQAELHASRPQMAATTLSLGISAFLLSAFVGRLVERIGIRPVAAWGALGFGICQGLIACVGHGIALWWSAWLAAFLFAQLIGPAAWAAAIVPLFTRNRGLALGITMAGVGVANLIVPVVAAAANAYVGWRFFYLLLGAWNVTILLPLSLVLLPVNPTRPATQQRDIGQGEPGQSSKEALSGTLFWRLLIAITLFAGTIGFLVINVQELLRDRGFSPMAAAAMAAAYGPAQIIGRLGAGILLDRVRGDRLAAVIFLLPAIGCHLLLTATSSTLLLLASMFAGLAAGVEIDVMAYLCSRYFGLRHYGAIYGMLFGTFSIAVGAGPLAGAMLRDAYGSYSMALWLSIGILTLASTLMATLGRYRY